MPDPLDFTGKVILVTGSSRGIGAEMIKAFGAHGGQCVVNYISDSAGQNKTDAETVARELTNPLVIDCDITDPTQVEAMMKQIQEQRGGLDILVNNSGIIRDRTIKKMALEEFESIIRVNLTGTFNVTRRKRPQFCVPADALLICRRSAARWVCSVRRIIRRVKPPLLP